MAAAFQSKTDRMLRADLTLPEGRRMGLQSHFQMGGWAPAPGPLALPPGGKGYVSYLFTFDPGEKVTARVTGYGGEISSRLLLQVGGIKVPPFFEIPLPMNEHLGAFQKEEEVDLTPWLGDAHFFYLTIESTRPAGGEAAPLPALAFIEIEFTGISPPPPSLAGALFFGLVCFGGWWAILGYLLPTARATLRRLAVVTPDRGIMLLVGTLVALGAFGAVVMLPVWRDPKPHDDFWALGNARLLALRRFNTEDLFFRSRVRPAFLAIALPLETLTARRLETVSFTPSDFDQRRFYVFDHPRTATDRVYPTESLWAAALGLLGLSLIAAAVLRIDRGKGRRFRAVAAMAFAAFFLARTLSGGSVSPISLTVTWTFEIAAMLAFVEWIGRPNRRSSLLLAAGLAGLAMLFKESALALVLPIGLIQLWLLWRRPEWRRRLPRLALFWLLAALSPLVYYGLVLNAGFAEIGENFRQHLASVAILEGYEARTPGGIARALWAVAGFGLPFALLGLAFARRHGSAAVVFLCWLMGGLTPLLLPYFYPRFFLNMIPALGWLAAAGTWGLLQLLQASHRKSGETMS